MRHLAITSLLLVACSGDDTATTSSTGGGGDTAAQVGSGGTGGEGGVTSAQSSTAEATTGAGGEGGDTASTTSAGGSGGAGSTASTGAGGAEPCEVGCVAQARVRCHEECPNSFDCEPLVCSDGDPLNDLTLQGGENRVELPPIPVQHPRCQDCGVDVLYSLRLTMPGIDVGCVSVDALPGIVWDITEDEPGQCPEERRECGLGAFQTSDASLWLVVTEPSQSPRVVTVTVTPDELCVGTPEPACAGECP